LEYIFRTSGDVTYTYNSCGLYEVTLTVIDSGDVCLDIPIDINIFDPTIFYDPCNQFMVQILSPGDPPAYPPAMTIISTGDFGMTVSATSDTLTLCVPRLSDYLAGGYQLGTYYMRIIATTSNDTVAPFDTTNVLGSVIRLSVKGVSAEVIDFFVHDQFGVPLDTLCSALGLMGFTINSPLVNTSNYYVEFLLENNLFAFYLWDPDVIALPTICCFNLDDWPSGNYAITIREVEKGFAPFQTTDFCVGPLSSPYRFYIEGNPDVSVSGSTTVCVGDTVTYSSLFKIDQEVCVGDSLTTSVQYLPATYYNWDFIDIFNIGSIVTLANNQITIAWNSLGSASIGLSALGRCGSNYGTTTITVAPGSDLKTTPDTTVCEGEPFELTAQNLSWLAYNTFSWIIDCDTIQQNYYEPGNTDILSVTPDTGFTVIVEVDNGCPDRDTITVSVVKLPKLESADAEICPGDTTLLNAVTSGAIAYEWYELPNTSAIISTDSSLNVSPFVTTDYTVTVTYDSICSPKSSTLTVIVNVPVVDAGNDKEIFRGDEVMLNASGGVTYSWVPAYGLSCTDCPGPTASPDTTTTYIVTITDIYGCIEQDTIIVKVILLEVPDAFTPDGDGINDVLYVYNLLGKKVGVNGDALESLDFKIFNRWGEVVFETTDINIGWEGKHMKTSRDMEVGVYVWLLIATTADGEDIGPISGNVSLIR